MRFEKFSFGSIRIDGTEVLARDLLGAAGDQASSWGPTVRLFSFLWFIMFSKLQQKRCRGQFQPVRVGLPGRRLQTVLALTALTLATLGPSDSRFDATFSPALRVLK